MAGIAKERRITSTNTLEMSFFMKSPPNIFFAAEDTTALLITLYA